MHPKDVKGAQPDFQQPQAVEQLVEEAREMALAEMELKSYTSYNLARKTLALATALSECRERGKLLEDVKEAAQKVHADTERVVGMEEGVTIDWTPFEDALAALAAQPPSEASERVASQPGEQPKADSERSGT